MESYINITAACHILNITSRTLRYYEQEGLISSIRTSARSPRLFTKEEIIKLKHILLLRSLGFSIKRIHLLLHENIDLLTALQSQKELLKNEIKEQEHSIHAISNAISHLNDGINIFDTANEINSTLEEQEQIAITCTQVLFQNNLDSFYSYLTSAARFIIPKEGLCYLLNHIQTTYGTFEKICFIESSQKYIQVFVQLNKQKEPNPITYMFYGNSIYAISLFGINYISN